ncbi:hypothetical protein ACFQZ2_00925, partial [Streptomonospora algeriensis]
ASRDSPASAAAASAELPAEAAAQLRAPAREAFALGLNAAALVGAIVMGVFGAVAIMLLRNERSADPEPTGVPEAAAVRHTPRTEAEEAASTTSSPGRRPPSCSGASPASG